MTKEPYEVQQEAENMLAELQRKLINMDQGDTIAVDVEVGNLWATIVIGTIPER